MKAIYPAAPEPAVSNLVVTFNRWAGKFGIDTPLKTAHFLAQLLHECCGLRVMEENLNYSAQGLLRTFPRYFNKVTANQYARRPQKIANRVYANRMGNGNEASGDGWMYRGRGCIMLTGKDNYRAYQNSGFCVGSIMDSPSLIAKSPGCFKSAMWFWWRNGINAIAETDNIREVTRKVNGGYNGLEQRSRLLAKAKLALGI